MGIVIRQSIKGSIVTYLGAFIGFLNTMFIATRFLSAEEIGLVRIMIEAAMTLSSLASLGIGSTGIRFFPYFRTLDGKHGGFFSLMCLLPVVGMVVFGLVYTLLTKPISDYFAQNSALFVNYYFYILPLAAFMVYQIITETYSSLLMRIVVPRFTREILLRVLYIGAILLYYFEVINLNGFIIIFICNYLLVALVNLFYIFKLKQVSFKVNTSTLTPEIKKDVKNYTLYAVVGSLAGILALKLDIFMISAEIGLVATGVYSIAYYMAAIIEMPIRSIVAITSPLVSEAMKNNDFKLAESYYKRVSLNQFFLGVFIFVLLWLNIDFVFAYMPNGDLYSEGKLVVLFLGLSKLVSMVFSFNTTIVTFSRYYKYTLLFTLFLGICIIVTNNILIPIFAINGAAIATLITVIAYHLLCTVFLQYKLKINPFSRGTLKCLFVLCFMLLLNFGLNFALVSIDSIFIESLIRTFVVLPLGLVLAMLLKTSEEMLSVAKNITKRVLRR